MSDVHLVWGEDCSSSETGDLRVVGRPELGTERVLRRLLTNPGAYVWHPEYGAGLARFVGRPVDAVGMQALIRAQMRLEAAVAREPEPVIDVRAEVTGTLSVQIRYADADTSEARALNIELPR